MFKTIEECRLDLVAHTQPVNADVSIDFLPCSAARVSFGNEDKTGENEGRDIKLMLYLAENQHMTPFEHQSATFLVECPLFIRSQIHRHRTFAYNEISRRYTDENLEFWQPTAWRGQAKSNRQASSDETVEYEGFYIAGATEFTYQDMMQHMVNMYHEMLEHGIAREQARAILPQSLLTKFYMTGNMRNWAHFLKLRLDEHAQYEVRVVAERINAKLTELWPNSMAALMVE